MAQVTKTSLRPLHDRLLVKRLEEGDKKHGSIIIPDSAKEKPQEGKVIAAGTGKVTDDGKKLPLDVKAGDRILFGKYSGSEVKLNGKEYLIIKEEDVLGILSASTARLRVASDAWHTTRIAGEATFGERGAGGQAGRARRRTPSPGPGQTDRPPPIPGIRSCGGLAVAGPSLSDRGPLSR